MVNELTAVVYVQQVSCVAAGIPGRMKQCPVKDRGASKEARYGDPETSGSSTAFWTRRNLVEVSDNADKARHSGSVRIESPPSAVAHTGYILHIGQYT